MPFLPADTARRKEAQDILSECGRKKQLDSSNKNPNKSQAWEEDVFFVTGRSSKSSCDKHWNKMFWDSPSFSHTLVLRAVVDEDYEDPLYWRSAASA